MTTSKTPRDIASLIVVLLAACTSGPDAISPITAEDEAAIRGVFAQWTRNVEANRPLDNLELIAEDAVELVPVARVGRSAIRERWLDFVNDYVYRSMTVDVKEIVGHGERAYAWAEFSSSFERLGEAMTQRGNLLWIFRKEPDGAWRLHRSSWMASTRPDTALASR
jgi:uncharacterized protein (TIGR02246 family)